SRNPPPSRRHQSGFVRERRGDSDRPARSGRLALASTPRSLPDMRNASSNATGSGPSARGWTTAHQPWRRITMPWSIARKHDHVAVVTMNTNKVNAQNPAFFADLHAAFDRLDTE